MPLTPERVEFLLRGWRQLHSSGGLNDLTETEVQFLIEEEMRGAARADILLRLHGRFNTLRCRREKQELLDRAKT